MRSGDGLSRAQSGGKLSRVQQTDMGNKTHEQLSHFVWDGAPLPLSHSLSTQTLWRRGATHLWKVIERFYEPQRQRHLTCD